MERYAEVAWGPLTRHSAAPGPHCLFLLAGASRGIPQGFSTFHSQLHMLLLVRKAHPRGGLSAALWPSPSLQEPLCLAPRVSLLSRGGGSLRGQCREAATQEGPRGLFTERSDPTLCPGVVSVTSPWTGLHGEGAHQSQTPAGQEPPLPSGLPDTRLVLEARCALPCLWADLPCSEPGPPASAAAQGGEPLPLAWEGDCTLSSRLVPGLAALGKTEVRVLMASVWGVPPRGPSLRCPHWEFISNPRDPRAGAPCPADSPALHSAKRTVCYDVPHPWWERAASRRVSHSHVRKHLPGGDSGAGAEKPPAPKSCGPFLPRRGLQVRAQLCPLS